MLFTLKNLGRLEEATIDLGKDLIVLTGRNNTSKSYVAHAVHGLGNYAGSDGPFLYDIVDRAPDLLFPHGDAPPSERIEIDLMRCIRDHHDFLLDGVSRECSAKLADFFAADPIFTARAAVTISLGDRELETVERRLMEIAYRETLGEERVSIEKPRGSSVLTVAWMPRPTTNGDHGSPKGSSLRETALNYAPWVLAEALLGPVGHAFIFIAERNGLQRFSSELAARRVEPRGAEAPPPYPLAITANLGSIYRMPAMQRGTSPFSPEALRLEQDILKGSVTVAQHGEMVFNPEGATEPLPMHLASSSVNALADLDFYLRHRAQKGDFLIIDEPELNLHSSNQRLVARLLARLARAGIKVMISTHSDYIVRELNNLLMLHRDKVGKLREKWGYGEDEILDPERVGAYAFDGVRAKPITIGPAGIKVEAFDQDTKALNRSASDIYFTLDDQDDEA